MNLYSWGARALYLGPALNLTPHRNAVAVLAVGIDAPFSVANNPSDASFGYRSCRSVFIPPNTLHHLMGTSGRMGFLYVDARSRDRQLLWTLGAEKTERASFDLSIEADLIERLGRLSSGAASWKQTREALDAIVSKAPARETDPRVRFVIRRLRAEPASRLALLDLARELGLSQSRLLHLFKEATGVPFRRYKVWLGVGAAMRAIGRGETLTSAALDGGFASSAHFSATFREMFGLEPSRLSRGGLQALPDNEAS
jgi:AraC-like DNA-binding protein